MRHRTAKRDWGQLRLGLVFWLLVLGTGLARPALAQEGVPPQLTVVAETVSIRSGPDATYPPFETLPQGRVMGIIGYNAATGWWQVVSSYGSPGWVSGATTEVMVNEAARQQFIPPAIPVAPPLTAANGPALPAAVPGAGTLVFQTAAGGAIYAINPDGSNRRYLATGMDPAVSPDGRQVAFTRWETSQDGALGSVWLIYVDGTGERVIHENVLNPRTPAWWADGTKLAIGMQHGGYTSEIRKCWGQRPPREAYDVSSDIDRSDRNDAEYCFSLPPDPHWGLRLIDLAAGRHEDLPGDDYSFSPAPDPANPNRVVYDGDRALVNLDLTTRQTAPLVADPNAHNPVFSPDGGKIALTYRQDDHWEVHVMNADGSGRLRLTETSYQELAQQILAGQAPHAANNVTPAWSPDGSQLAFLTDRGGQWEIWLMNADGTNQRPMFPAGTLADISLEYRGTDEQMLSWR